MFRFYQDFNLDCRYRNFNKEERLEILSPSFIDFNNLIKVCVKKRSQSESSYISNKECHIKFGNRASSGDHLKVLYQNVPGKTLSPQGIEIAIKLVLAKHKPAMLALAEPAYDILRAMHFPGYRLIKGKLTGGRKFRLNVLINENLVDYSIETFTTEVPSLLIRCGKFKFLFFYREWNVDARANTDAIELQEARWKTFLHRAKRITGKVTMMGDANICYLNSDSAHQQRLNNMREDLFEMLADKGLAQLIKEDTRHQKEQKGLLDHIYTKQLSHVAEVYNENIHGHDHNCVGILLRTDRTVFKTRMIAKRSYDKVDPDYFHQLWIQSNPQEIFETDDLEKMIAILEFKIHHVLDLCCPVKLFRTSENYAPWVNPAIKKLIKERNALRKAAIRGEVPWSDHKSKKKEVDKVLKEAETSWKSSFLDFSDDKTGWRRLKQVSGLKQNTENKMQLMIDGELVDDPEILATHINDFFIAKIERITEEFPPNPVESIKYTQEYIKNKPIGHFKFRTVDYKMVKKVIASLKNVDSCGLDNIPVVVYKKFRSSLTPALTRIINKAIETSQYPERYKHGVISPVPKKGNLEEVGNWRPVVLLPVASRLLEGVLCRQIRGYIENWGLLSTQQHAYRSNKSCISAWMDMDTRVNLMRDQGKAIGCLMSDLQGAFNTLSADTLLPKLRMLGFSLSAVMMLSSYLGGRKNQTKVESVMSAPRDVVTGCGEGSVAGPLAWCLHLLCSPAVVDRVKNIVDDPDHPDRPAEMPLMDSDQYSILEIIFADDVNHLVSARTNEEVIWIKKVISQEYFKYFSALGLKESKGKRQHIIFSKFRDKDNPYMMDERKAEDFIKLLGITVSKDWTFDKHVSNVVGRVQSRIPHLMAIRKSVSPQILHRVSNSLCNSIITYGIEVTGMRASTQKRLQKAMNRVLRCVTFGDRRTPIRQMLLETKWLNVNLLWRFFTIMNLQRIILFESSIITYNQINFNYNRVRYNTRHHNLYLFWKPKTASGWESSLQKSTQNFNELGLLSGNWYYDDDKSRILQDKLRLRYDNGNI